MASAGIRDGLQANPLDSVSAHEGKGGCVC